jgi:CheY-like chemotaxis protein
VAAGRNGLELVCALDPSVPRVVRGDPTRIRQVLNNLVSNAVKFTERGEVVTRVVVQSSESERAVLHFTVSDTGIGIPSEKHHKIFEAFCQADSSTTRRFGGTGLGLTVSARLVSMMGGRTWLESEIGRGSHFHFTVSLSIPEQQEELEMAPASRLQGARVLVVDDNATNRRILEDVLKNWGMLVTAVDSGRAALDCLSAVTGPNPAFHLMITDGHMPEMDGPMLIEEVQRMPGVIEAIILLTSAGQRGDAAYCRRLGVSAYLTKPVRQPELQAAALLALDRSLDVLEHKLITRHMIRGTQTAIARRILVAEDNLVNQTLAVKLLEKAGCRSVVVANGRDALSALERETFDLVLMDLQMPGMDGLEATAAIREGERATGAHMPIVALTACAIKGDEERCRAAGMDAYLPKPIQAQRLYDLLDSLLPLATGPAPH